LHAQQQGLPDFLGNQIICALLDQSIFAAGKSVKHTFNARKCPTCNRKKFIHNDGMNAPIFIDFEASGFGKDSYPIEVGFSVNEEESWCSLIKPEQDWQHWDPQAAQLHCIPRELLVQHGRPALFVAEQLNHFLAGCVVYTDGWMNDYVWMARLFDVAKRVPQFRLEDLRLILSTEQVACWQATKSRILIEQHLTRHRASSDARILQLTWLHTRQNLPT
jgi:hypothetical protein